MAAIASVGWAREREVPPESIGETAGTSDAGAGRKVMAPGPRPRDERGSDEPPKPEPRMDQLAAATDAPPSWIPPALIGTGCTCAARGWTQMVHASNDAKGLVKRLIPEV